MDSRCSLRSLLLTGAVWIAGVSAASAEGWTAGGGIFVPEGNFSDVSENGYQVFLGYGFGFGPVEIEPTARYMWADGPTGAQNVKILGGEVTGRVNVLFLYAVGALGYYQVERSISSDNLLQSDNWDVSYSFGVGWDIGPVFLEARYQKIQSDRDSGFFPITVGVRF